MDDDVDSRFRFRRNSTSFNFKFGVCFLQRAARSLIFARIQGHSIVLPSPQEFQTHRVPTSTLEDGMISHGAVRNPLSRTLTGTFSMRLMISFRR